MAFGIWNQLDEIGLYVNLSRLAGETDEDYFARIKLFTKWGYRTNYKTQAHSIPIQAGLRTFPVCSIECTLPFECILDWEYLTLENFPENILFSDGVTSHHTQLSHRNIQDSNDRYTIKFLPDTFCKNRKTSVSQILVKGDYVLDCNAGVIDVFNDPNTPISFDIKYELKKEYYRIFVNTDISTVNNVDVSIINKIRLTLANSATLTVNVPDESKIDTHQNFLIRSKNTEVFTDYVSSKYQNLTNRHIVKGSFTPANDTYCRSRKASLQTLKVSGDYFLDEEAGYLQTLSVVDTGFYATYKFYEPKFIIEGTELNLVPLNILTQYGVTDELINMLPYILDQKVWGK